LVIAEKVYINRYYKYYYILIGKGEILILAKSLSQILIVDDNEDILFHLSIILEDNGFQVKTANNGKEALKILSEVTKRPDLIISDIMMPEMDGYDLFSKVSENPLWNLIPFIFLTAKITPEEIRFGKILGVDDYLTKPFSTEDLLAVIRGKIERAKKTAQIDLKVKELIFKLGDPQEIISEEEKEEVILLYVEWDDRVGPKVKKTYSIKNDFPFSLDKIGSQLFLAANFIYGNDNIVNAQGILLNIENINRSGYLFFDSIPQTSSRSGEDQFGLIVVAPKINYLQSLKIKAIFEKLSYKIKKNESWDENFYWKKLVKVLTSSSL